MTHSKVRAGLLAGLLLAVLPLGAAFLTFPFDAPVREAVVSAQGKKWKKSDDYKFHSAVRKFGDWPWLMGAGACGLLVAWRLRDREWMQILAAAMLASTLAGMIANSSRLVTGRTRPRESPQIAQGFYGPWHEGKSTIGNPAFNSFPSGHTATAFGFAGVIAYARPWLGIGALLLAALIAFSSIVMGTHHPSDVAASTVLALATSWMVWKWVRDHGEDAARRLAQRLRAMRTREAQGASGPSKEAILPSGRGNDE